jgi:hypothetical protein
LSGIIPGVGLAEPIGDLFLEAFVMFAYNGLIIGFAGSAMSNDCSLDKSKIIQNIAKALAIGVLITAAPTLVPGIAALGTAGAVAVGVGAGAVTGAAVEEICHRIDHSETLGRVFGNVSDNLGEILGKER